MIRIDPIHLDNIEGRREGQGIGDSHGLSALINICRVAAERFEEHARTFDKCAATGGNPMITPAAAKALAETFREQAKEARELANLGVSSNLIIFIEEPR